MTRSAPSLFILSLLLPCVYSHTFLTSPDAYNRKFQLRSCKRRGDCSQACPSEIPSKMRNTPEYPPAHWYRGQTVRINWARNNHQHGFVRIAIVPFKKRMSRKWHKRLAIWYGCFSQGKSWCYGDACGSDNTGHSYGAQITIPTYLEDGAYVLGLSWFGGVHWPLSKKENFSDYWSCSYIKIWGGAPVGGFVQPSFHPGNDPFAKHHNGKCLSATDAPEKCPYRGCKGRPSYQVPRPFKGGRRPKIVTVEDIRSAM